MIEIVAPLRIDLGGGETDVKYISDVIGTCIVNVGIDPYLDQDYTQPTQISCSADHIDFEKSIFSYNNELAL